MPGNGMRPVVKIEQGVDAEEGLQEEAGAGRAVQRRRVGEAGDAARDEKQLFHSIVEAQAQAIRSMEQTRVLGEALQRANVRVSELSTQNAVCAGELKANAEALQANDIIIQLNHDLFKAKESELRLLREDIARRDAWFSDPVAANRPLPLQAATGEFSTFCLRGESGDTCNKASVTRPSAGDRWHCSSTRPRTRICRIC
jgi:hypothetical protein